MMNWAGCGRYQLWHSFIVEQLSEHHLGGADENHGHLRAADYQADNRTRTSRIQHSGNRDVQ
jgi:hypothetical protein